MRLTKFTDFGLRALMRMASLPDRAFSIAKLSQEFALSRHHLTKIIAALSQAGIVVTQRGGGGGAVLARPADQIKLGDVVRVREAGQILVDCFAGSGGGCSITATCRLKARMQSAERAFLADMDRSTLADVALPASAD